MKFKARKVYGSYKLNKCPFCGRFATQKNEQGQEVCYQHIKTVLEEIKCTCGRWLEPKTSKFGNYYHCTNCGNINNQKAQEMKSINPEKSHSIMKEIAVPEVVKTKPREITITSDDVEYFS